MNPIYHPCRQRRVQSPSHQFRNRLTQRQRTTLGIAPHYGKNIIIETEGGAHDTMMPQLHFDVNI